MSKQNKNDNNILIGFGILIFLLFVGILSYFLFGGNSNGEGELTLNNNIEKENPEVKGVKDEKKPKIKKETGEVKGLNTNTSESAIDDLFGDNSVNTTQQTSSSSSNSSSSNSSDSDDSNDNNDDDSDNDDSDEDKDSDDDEKPDIDFKNLENGDVLSGTYKVKVDFSDNKDLDEAKFEIKDEKVKECEIDNKEDECDYEWNTTDFTDGEYKIVVKAKDKEGNEKEEDKEITIDNTKPNILSITRHLNSSAHNGNTAITIQANDNTGINELAFYTADNLLKKCSNTNICIFDYKASVEPNSIRAKVIDRANNYIEKNIETELPYAALAHEVKTNDNLQYYLSTKSKVSDNVKVNKLDLTVNGDLKEACSVNKTSYECIFDYGLVIDNDVQNVTALFTVNDFENNKTVIEKRLSRNPLELNYTLDIDVNDNVADIYGTFDIQNDIYLNNVDLTLLEYNQNCNVNSKDGSCSFAEQYNNPKYDVSVPMNVFIKDIFLNTINWDNNIPLNPMDIDYDESIEYISDLIEIAREEDGLLEINMGKIVQEVDLIKQIEIVVDGYGTFLSCEADEIENGECVFVYDFGNGDYPENVDAILNATDIFGNVYNIEKMFEL